MIRLNLFKTLGVVGAISVALVLACSGPPTPAAAPPAPVPAPAVAITSTPVPPTATPVPPTPTSTPLPPTSTPMPTATTVAISAPTVEPATATRVPPTATPEPVVIEVMSEIVDFTLENLTVAVGTKVTWVNEDRAPHTTTSGKPPNRLTGDWDSGLLNQSGVFSFTFDRTGEFPYFCTLHPYMDGTIVVTESGAASPGQQPGGQSQVVATAVPPTPTSIPTVAPTPEPEPVVITSEIDDFTLEDLTVNQGTTVNWVNKDRASHTATSGLPPRSRSRHWDSDTMRPEDSFSFTFDTPGTFPYFCAIHPFMTATVTVVEPGSSGSIAPSPSAPPNSPNITTGGYGN